MDAEIHAKKGKENITVKMQGTGRDLIAMTVAINLWIKDQAHLDMLEYMMLMCKKMIALKDIEKGVCDYDIEVDEDALKEILKGGKDG